MPRHSLSLVIAASLLALAPDAGSAQSPRANVLMQLNQAARSAAARGFRPDPAAFNRDAVVGMLASRTSSFMELNLTGGASYVISGACDEDCADMDLRLFPSTSSDPLVQDTEDDDNPVISFVAPRTGRYMLAVDMARCQERLCYYAFRVLRR